MRRVAALLLCLLSAPALAGRPFATEDAGVLAAGECELEAFVLRASGRDAPIARGGALQPNCGIGWQTQLGIAAGRTEAAGEAITSLALAGKTALRELTETQTGFALAYGVVGARLPGHGFKHDSTALAGVVSAPLDKALVLHANLGWLRTQADRLNTTAWALALERTGLFERLDVGAEVYGDDRMPGAFFGIGARYAVMPEKFFVDFSWARSSSGSRATLATLGIKISF